MRDDGWMRDNSDGFGRGKDMPCYDVMKSAVEFDCSETKRRGYPFPPLLNHRSTVGFLVHHSKASRDSNDQKPIHLLSQDHETKPPKSEVHNP